MKTFLPLLLTLFSFSAIQAETLNYSSETFSSVQDAIDQLQASTNTNRILSIPKEAIDNASFTISDNISIQGVETGGSWLRNSDNINAIITIEGDVFVNISNLTFTSANQAISLGNSSQANINNNVFSLGNTNLAILAESDSSANIFNNTFFSNNIAIQAEQVLQIKNNIFSMSASNSILGLAVTDNLSFNFFEDEPNNNLLGNDNVIGSSNFVSSGTLDFHLTVNSDAINNGNIIHGNDIVDDSTPDLGAYGGNLADTFPAEVLNVSVSDNNSTGANNLSANVTWDQNTNYLVQGYFIYYDIDSDLAPLDADFSGNGATSASPIILGDVQSYSFDNIDLGLSLSAPNSLTAESLTNEIQLSWEAVESASGYSVEHRVTGTANFTTQNTTTNSFSVVNLTNGTSYDFRVKAYQTPVFYVGVSAYYDQTDTSTGSNLLNSVGSLTLDTNVESDYSDTVVASPDETVAVPSLPNNGGGCLLR